MDFTISAVLFALDIYCNIGYHRIVRYLYFIYKEWKLMITKQTVINAVYGAAIGDAVGVPYEFKSREAMKASPATRIMKGSGTYNKPSGTWSDDTSMILCTLDKLDEKLDYDAVIKAFCQWRYNNEYTSDNDCFDVGRTTFFALRNYYNGVKALESGLDDEYSNGNGSLMRIIPAALYIAAHNVPIAEGIEINNSLSMLTHAHERSQTGCGIFTFVALELIKNPCKESVKEGLEKARKFYNSPEAYNRLWNEDFFTLNESFIVSSGYVVDTLECALWSLMNTESYCECILRAVNFGNDTDTAACVAGALAGLLYGVEGMPSDWINQLRGKAVIDRCIQAFCTANGVK